MISKTAIADTLQKFGVVADRVDLTRAYLDFDRRRVPRLRPIWSVCRIVGLRPLWIESRRTRRGWHVIVKLNDRLLPAELIALQAVLRSDPRRETLNLCRVLGMRRSPIRSAFWRKRWNLLYDRKLESTRIV